MAQELVNREPVVVERVQTGVRMEKRMLKVLKAVAELKDMTLGDLLEGIVLHAFEGKIVPFSPQTLKEIEQFKALYGMTLKATDSHNLKERKRWNGCESLEMESESHPDRKKSLRRRAAWVGHAYCFRRSLNRQAAARRAETRGCPQLR